GILRRTTASPAWLSGSGPVSWRRGARRELEDHRSRLTVRDGDVQAGRQGSDVERDGVTTRSGQGDFPLPVAGGGVLPDLGAAPRGGNGNSGHDLAIWGTQGSVNRLALGVGGGRGQQHPSASASVATRLFTPRLPFCCYAPQPPKSPPP